jgi:diaminopimelate decarboxylase
MYVVWTRSNGGGIVGQGLLVPPETSDPANVNVQAPAANRESREAIHFPRVSGVLRCEGVPIERLAAAAGTPCYVYSAAAIRSAYEEITNALSGVPHRIHYSVKANSNLAILSLLRSQGAAVDVVSGGELHRALQAGFSDNDIVFGGVGKTEHELHMAVSRGLKLINVESEGELERLAGIVRAHDTQCQVALRINPEVTVDTPHPYTRTGVRGMKFGIPHDRALAAAKRAIELPGIKLVGLDFHIGSQISAAEPYRAALERMEALINAVRALGAVDLRFLDAGGGLGVTYDSEIPLDTKQFADLVVPVATRCGMELIVEPGRFLLGHAAVLVARVIDTKHSGGKDFLIVDAGMNDLLRPSHYNSYHRISAVRSNERSADRRVDVVGPVCESGDFLGLDRDLPDLAVNDLIAVHTAGAYGFCMSSNYNSRPRSAEVLVDGDRFAIIRERESYDDLVRNEVAAPRWRSPAPESAE